MKAAINKKCSKLIKIKDVTLHQANARLYVSLLAKQKLLQIVWNVFTHLWPMMHLRLSFIWVFREFFQREKKIQVSRASFCSKRQKVLRQQSYKVAFKIEESKCYWIKVDILKKILVNHRKFLANPKNNKLLFFSKNKS